jgi:hypothetical protein
VAGKSTEGRLTVDGVLVQYRAMLLSDGTLSVGTIHKVW